MSAVSRKKAVLPMVGLPDDIEGCCPSILAAPLDESDAAELAQGFAALADPARLRLFSLIAAQPEGEVCACALVEPLGRSQPTVSHHLRVLYQAGLVDREKRGTWVWYRPVPGRLEALRAALAAGDSAGVLGGTVRN
jgi:ArsR family transcriptional regulator